MFKKLVLVFLFVVALVTAFVIPSFAVSPLTTSINFSWNDYLSSSYNFTDVSPSNNNSKNTNFSFNYNGGSLWFALADFDSFGLLSGESYQLRTSVWISSATASHNCRLFIGLVDSLFSSGSLGENLTWFYESDVLSAGTTPINVSFSVPANYQQSYFIVQFVPSGSTSFNGILQMNYANLNYVNKVDSGSWSGDDVTFPSLDMSDDEQSFGEKQQASIDWITEQMGEVSDSIRSVSLLFGEVWSNLMDVVPEYVFLLVFSLLGGAFVFVITKYRL